MLPILENEIVRKSAYPVTVDLYREMLKSGKIIAKTELLEGAIIESKPMDLELSGILYRMYRFFYENMISQYTVRKEEKLTFKHSVLVPDFDVISKKQEGVPTAPKAAVHLVAEISGSNLPLDIIKSLIYARAGIAECWIINMNNSTLEAYRNPSPEGYQTKKIHAKNEPVSPGFFPYLRLTLDSFINKPEGAES